MKTESNSPFSLLTIQLLKSTLSVMPVVCTLYKGSMPFFKAEKTISVSNENPTPKANPDT
jgi:hypothetical protein